MSGVTRTFQSILLGLEEAKGDSLLWYTSSSANLLLTSSMKASCHASEIWTVIFKNYAPTPHTYNPWSLQPSQPYFWSLPMPAVPGRLWALLRGWTAKEVVHSSSKNTTIQKLRTKLRDSVLPINTVKPQNWYIVRKPHSFLFFIIFQLTPYSSFICAFIITSLQNSTLSQAAE